MSNDKLLMMIYRMNNRQGCLMVQIQGKRPCKILKILEPLKFVGWMKQLSMAIDTGADQKNCEHNLECADGMERLIKCRFVLEVVKLELWVRERVKLCWKGTAREFGTAVDRMIEKMPKFF